VRFVPTVVHGIADYVVGLVVIALPFVYGWTGTPRWLFIVLGAVVILYSLLTDYELGVVRVLRLRFHLLLDAVFGIVMLALPWLLNFPVEGWWAPYVLGVLALILVFTTKTRALGTAPGHGTQGAYS
jgi:hypothetical protein